ncbi:MAG: DUF6311 domain-containing protein [Clostridiales bacterium]|nr:DUF6311 domain-containing protein [Clostridiales bacterium]
MKKERQTKEMKFKVKNPDSLKWYFLIGALIGAVLFVAIYGFGVLNVTNDAWLLTGKDLQQHYIGWKYYRDAAWTFPIGCHDGLTHPYMVSVLYTDSIPLFAIFFKLLSPILPETFQYFGLFGLMCYMLNGGFAALLLAKINKSKFVCALGSVFFVLSTPVLQRLFGLITENSRHTSLAAHFLILAAMAIWLYREKFDNRWKVGIAYAILGVLCVLIQMYIIFIVGGIMCGYLLHEVLRKKDWKRVFIVFGLFGICSLTAFFVVGGFTDVLTATGEGYGRYSANLNALINPYHYSSFFSEMPWCYDQYEGFSYLGLGIIVLYVGMFVYLLTKMVVKVRKCSYQELKTKAKEAYQRHRNGIIPLAVVSIVFWVLAISTRVYWGERIILEVFPPKKVSELLDVIRSSGRFMWVIMYLAILFAIYLLTRFVKNKNLQKIILVLCICLQIADLSAPIGKIHNQFATEAKEDERFADDVFWKEKLGNYKNIVYYPLGSCGLYHMLQIGTKASYFDIDMNYFYMSRFYTDKVRKNIDKKNRELFASGNLADDTIYILNYRNAHKYKDKCYLYEVDNTIIAVKNPIEGVKPYNDVYVSKDNPEVQLEFSYTGLGRAFAHNGWNAPSYTDTGMWTSVQSVIRVYSGGAKRVRITLDYDGGKRKGKTTIKMNGKEMAKIEDNSKSGSVSFETNVKETIDEKKSKGVNWLFLNTNKTFKAKQENDIQQRAVYIKKMTVTYLE